MFRLANKNDSAFSLIELMVVISILALLSTISIAKVKIFNFRAHQAEAQINLTHAHVMLESHKAEKDCYNQGCIGYTNYFFNYTGTCLPIAFLGFNLQPCEKLRYFYKFYLGPNDFEVTAMERMDTSLQKKTLLPRCANRWDRWIIDENRVLTNNGIEVSYPSLAYMYGTGVDLGEANKFANECL